MVEGRDKRPPTEAAIPRSTAPRSTAMKIVRASLLASLAAASLAACGGGGGGGGVTPSPPILPPPPAAPPPPPPPPPPPASSFETSEYFGSGFVDTTTGAPITARSGLGPIKASSAYAAGATGTGITVAVIDSGVDGTGSELAGQISSSHDIITGRAAGDTDPEGHATLVASVIVAKQNGVGIEGVAFNAKVLSVRADTAGSCATTGANAGCSFSDANLITAIHYAVDNGAKVINMSLGGDPSGGQDPALRAAVLYAVQHNVLVVAAAGNDAAPASGSTPAKGTGVEEPAIYAGDPIFNGMVVAAGSVDPSGKISSFSNRAGTATMNAYVLAPGENIIAAGSPDSTGKQQYAVVSGTSFSTPLVAGSLALLLQAFPNLTPKAAMQILLTTTDDYVDPTIDPVEGVAAGTGADAVGGLGMIDLQKAFSPIGQTSFSFNGLVVPLGTALAPAKGALGDWAARAFDGLVFQDAYQRGFRLNAPTLAPSAAPFNDLAVRASYQQAQAYTANLAPNTSFSWFSPPKPIYDPRDPFAEAPEPSFEVHSSFSGTSIDAGRGGSGPQSVVPGMMLLSDPSGPATLESGLTWSSISHAFGPVTADFRASSGGGRSSSGFGFSRGGPDWMMRLGFSSLDDNLTALGGALQTRFGETQNDTHLSAISLESAHAFGSWTLYSSLEAASVKFDQVAVGGLWTSSWSLSAEHGLLGGDAILTAAQPRRAEGGSISFNAPVAITKTGDLVFEDRIASLTPSGRETDFEASWRKSLDAFTTIEAAAALSLEPNHVANAPPASAFWLSLRRVL